MATTNEAKSNAQGAYQLVTSLKVFRQCKHSVRYNALDADNPILQSIYLGREAYDELGKPERISIEIKSA